MRFLYLVIIIFCCESSQAQKWSLRLSYNTIGIGSNVQIKSWNGSRQYTKLHNHLSNRSNGQQIREFLLHNFWEFSVTRSLTKHQSIIIGFRNQLGYITHRIETNPINNVGAFDVGDREAQDMPAIRLGYGKTIYNASDSSRNSSFVNFTTGVLLFFRGHEGNTFGGEISYTYTTVNSTGSVTDTVSVYRRKDGVKRPLSPIPYLNLGIDGNIRLGKRYKIGAEFAINLGYTSLFTQKFYAKTHEAEFTYDVSLKPYFFTFGIFFQYYIK